MPKVPPTETISASLKLAEVSLSVKVKLAVWPDFKAEAEEVMVIVGERVSTVMEIVLEAVLLLPAVSVKVLAKTLMLADAVVFAVGVKIAL